MEEINYQNNMGNGPVQPIDDSKTLSIVALVLSIVCCNIISIVFGILAIIKSNDVAKYQGMGQTQMALSAAKNAKLFSWIAIGVIIFGFILNIIIMFAMGGIEGYMNLMQELSNQ